MIYVTPEDALLYVTLIKRGLTIYESQDGLTCHTILGDKTYEMQLKEVGDDKFILLYIKEVNSNE